MRASGVLTWANVLTLTRLLLCLPLYLLIRSESWLWASVCLFVAVLSDIFDGKVARKQGNTSPLGGFFDHATDAILVTTSCFALAQSEFISFWLVWLIPVAFIQYSLDSRVLAGHAVQQRPRSRQRHWLFCTGLQCRWQSPFRVGLAAKHHSYVQLGTGRQHCSVYSRPPAGQIRATRQR